VKNKLTNRTATAAETKKPLVRPIISHQGPY
jgi:hypothetical protein